MVTRSPSAARAVTSSRYGSMVWTPRSLHSPAARGPRLPARDARGWGDDRRADDGHRPIRSRGGAGAARRRRCQRSHARRGSGVGVPAVLPSHLPLRGVGSGDHTCSSRATRPMGRRDAATPVGLATRTTSRPRRCRVMQKPPMRGLLCVWSDRCDTS